MSTFTVNPSTLEALQRTISSLHEELSRMHCMAPSYSGVLGGSDLEDEVGNFLDAWHTGVALIEEDMQKVVQRLGEAVQGYGQSESFITAASCGRPLASQ
jgi:hypothetical protein